jgi:hypothetical protein
VVAPGPATAAGSPTGAVGSLGRERAATETRAPGVSSPGRRGVSPGCCEGTSAAADKGDDTTGTCRCGADVAELCAEALQSCYSSRLAEEATAVHTVCGVGRAARRHCVPLGLRWPWAAAATPSRARTGKAEVAQPARRGTRAVNPTGLGRAARRRWCSLQEGGRERRIPPGLGRPWPAAAAPGRMRPRFPLPCGTGTGLATAQGPRARSRRRLEMRRLRQWPRRLHEAHHEQRRRIAAPVSWRRGKAASAA